MRKKQNEDFWKKELDYINNVNPLLCTTFNKDMGCFEGYVVMQATFALEDGFINIARLMLNKINKG